MPKILATKVNTPIGGDSNTKVDANKIDLTSEHIKEELRQDLKQSIKSGKEEQMIKSYEQKIQYIAKQMLEMYESWTKKFETIDSLNPEQKKRVLQSIEQQSKQFNVDKRNIIAYENEIDTLKRQIKERNYNFQEEKQALEEAFKKATQDKQPGKFAQKELAKRAQSSSQGQGRS